MPHASEYHDDGVYFIAAKSLAERGESRIESFPGDPAQTKFPPLWPAVLSIAWHLSPHYPENLPYAMALCWMWLPISTLALWWWLGRAGFSPDRRTLLTTVWALNPYVILFSTTMLSEMMFLSLLLLTMIALSGRSVFAVLAAAIFAAMAFQTRTAGIAILPAALLLYAMRRRWLHAGIFAAIFLPVLAGWALWTTRNRFGGNELITLYYTDYVGFYLRVFSWQEAYLYVWKNLDGVVHGLGALVLPDVSLSMLEKVVALTAGIAGLAGTYKLAKRDLQSPVATYAIFSLFYVAMLVIWHYPPNERFMLPVAPLWLAGLWEELRTLALNIQKVFRKPKLDQKIAAAIMGAAVAAVLTMCVVRQFALLTSTLPEFYASHARRLEESEPAMQWIRDNLPAHATFLSENDPLLYLRTGRRGAGMMLTTIHWYRDDHAARTADHARAADHAVQQRLGYFLLSETDFARDMPAEEQKKLYERLTNEPRLELLFKSGPTGVYRVR
ncbi:MAG: hypothetical protein FJW30_24050 [Acidobacteria bacterium]|nr:hypothetical protein [Acidobacteriota bacterium]